MRNFPLENKLRRLLPKANCRGSSIAFFYRLQLKAQAQIHLKQKNEFLGLPIISILYLKRRKKRRFYEN
jgi:hypothetical protein